MNLYKNIVELRNENYLISILVLFSALIRVPVTLILGDTSLENEWGILLYNLINHQTS